MSTQPGRFRRAWQHVRSEPGLRRNVILLAAVVVLGLVAGGVILVHQRLANPLATQTYVWATFDSAPGISPGNGDEVRIAGVPVGYVVKARPDSQAHAQLLLRIDKSQYAKPVYSNASVVLAPKSPLNDMYVELNPGSASGVPLHQYGVLPLTDSRSPVEVDQALSNLDPNTQAALESLLSSANVALANASSQVPPGAQATDSVLKNIQPVVAQLNQRREKISQLVTAVAEISNSFGNNDQQLASLAGSLQTTLNALASQSGSLQQSLTELPGFAGQLHGATGEVQRLSNQLDPTIKDLNDASGSLPKSLSQFDATVHGLRTTVRKAGPVAGNLTPVARDLRPVVANANPALGNLEPISAELDPVTAGLTGYLPDLGAFVYNTNSLTSLRDADGGILRGLLQAGPSSAPVKGLGNTSPTQH